MLQFLLEFGKREYVESQRIMMNLLVSWKDSVQILRPRNLKPFLLVTLKTVIDTYRCMNRPLTDRGNWVLAGILVTLIILTNVIKLWNIFWLEALILNSLNYFLIFMFCLGMRDSTIQKNKDYFFSYTRKFWYLLVTLVIVGTTPIFVIPFLFMWYVFFMLFTLDSFGAMKDVVRAARSGAVMIWYNLPLCAVIFFVLGLLNIALYESVTRMLGYWGGLTIATILYLIFIPIEVALLVNVYIKRLHDQPELYFDQPKQ